MISSEFSYPDPAIEVLDKRFTFKIGNAAVERISTGYRWVEGPVYLRDQRCLYWSDIPNNRIMRWLEDDGRTSVFRSPSNYANGNTRDNLGRLVTCEHGARRVTRTEYDGSITTILDKYEGKRLNAPNDVVVDRQGAIWFSDPGYGIDSDYEGHAAEPELPRYVYRVSPATGKARVVADDFGRPNGLAFSPDETTLYIVDSVMLDDARPSIRQFKVNGEKLSEGRVFADEFSSGTSDGIKVDRHGNIWCSIGWGDRAENGVRCYSPQGELLGKIHLPEPCSNLCFGGEKNNRLFMTAGTSVYAVYLNTNGI